MLDMYCRVLAELRERLSLRLDLILGRGSPTCVDDSVIPVVDHSFFFAGGGHREIINDYHQHDLFALACGGRARRRSRQGCATPSKKAFRSEQRDHTSANPTDFFCDRCPLRADPWGHNVIG